MTRVADLGAQMQDRVLAGRDEEEPTYGADSQLAGLDVHARSVAGSDRRRRVW
jgi:hypothetical protein